MESGMPTRRFAIAIFLLSAVPFIYAQKPPLKAEVEQRQFAEKRIDTPEASNRAGVKIMRAANHDWQRHAETLDTCTKRLEAGKPYRIRLEYFEAVGTATVGFGVIRQAAGFF
jgi:hypothetical protein